MTIAVSEVNRSVTIRRVVNTRTVTRRSLRFRSVCELEREADRLSQGDRAGSLRAQGNWTLGQAFGHVGSWIDYFYVGFPMAAAPLAVRLLGRLMKRRFLNRSFSPGFRFAGAKEGTYGVERLVTDEGLIRLKAALGRLKEGEKPKHPSPVFGMLSVEELTRLSLRHAELHLGFFDA